MIFKRKTATIDAFQFNPAITCEELYKWAGIPYEVGQEPKPEPFEFAEGTISIKTGKGKMVCRPGDWIVRNKDGFYQMPDDKLREMYDPAEPETPSAPQPPIGDLIPGIQIGAPLLYDAMFSKGAVIPLSGMLTAIREKCPEGTFEVSLVMATPGNGHFVVARIA